MTCSCGAVLVRALCSSSEPSFLEHDGAELEQRGENVVRADCRRGRGTLARLRSEIYEHVQIPREPVKAVLVAQWIPIRLPRGIERRSRVWTYDREVRTAWRRIDGTRIPLAVN